MPVHLLIAGGGIGGLSAALALAQKGHRIEVIEQAAAFGEIGAGVQLGPNVTRRLKALGLGDAVDAIAARPDALVVRDAASHAELAQMPLAGAMERRYGAPYVCVHRADLHTVLLEAVRARREVSLTTDARIEHIEVSDELVCASSADARAWEADGLVGADGLWSTVRKQVELHATPPRLTGHTAWRALLPQSALPAALRRQQVEVWLGARLHALVYPVRGGQWLNLVVIAESAPAGDARDWDQSSNTLALREATGRCCPELQALLEAVPTWRAWSLCDRAPLTSVDDMAQGRVALLGDSAHPMVPYLAQGAGMAIEDAVALADAMGDCIAADVPAALTRYAATRWQRNARVQARARRNGEIFHATGAVRLGRDLAMRALGKALLDQPWLYGY